NPRVEDIPEQYGVRLGNIRLLVMGHIPKARGGCACPENIFVRELVSHALLQNEEVVIMDMEAGIEHLGRGTAEGVEAMLIVVEPSAQSIETARRIQRLASDLGVKKVFAVANKIENDSDMQAIKRALPDIQVMISLEWSEDLRGNSFKGKGVELSNGLRERMNMIMKLIADI
ncbi:MAG TPA: carbon monoxide dehydrogenase, partial [bacterium]